MDEDTTSTSNDENADYDNWRRKTFHIASLGSEAIESGYTFANQCGTLVEIPSDITPFERGALETVKNAQKLFDEHGADFQLIFYPDPPDRPGGYPVLKACFRQEDLFELYLEPNKSNPGLVYWNHNLLGSIPVNAPDFFFKFSESPLALAILISKLTVLSQTQVSKRMEIVESPSRTWVDRFVSSVVEGGDEQLGDKDATELAKYVEHFNELLEAEWDKQFDEYLANYVDEEKDPSWLDGPDPEDECINDGSCRLPCFRCDEEAHLKGTCRKVCCLEEA